MDNAPQPEPINIPVDFSDASRAPIFYANLFVIQQQQEQEFIITIGQAAPVLLSDPQTQMRQAEEMGTVPIKTIARFAVTEHRLAQLIDILQGNLTHARQSRGEGGDDGNVSQ